MNGRYRYLLARLRDLMIAGGVVTAARARRESADPLRGGPDGADHRHDGLRG